MLDSSRTFGVDKAAMDSEGVVTVNYKNAKTGTNEYISVMLVNDENEVAYYGQVKMSTSSSGSVSFSLPTGVSLGDYSLKIFNEQINDAYKTDFSSALVEISSMVEFETNGGTIQSGNLTSYTPGEETPLPTDVTRDGYVFMGWYESSDFSGSKVTEIAATETSFKKYYAKWIAKSDLKAVTFEVTDVEHVYKRGTSRGVTITPKSNGGALSPSDFTVIYYEVSENKNELRSTEAITTPIEIGTYLYSIDFANDTLREAYYIDRPYVARNKNLPSLDDYDNVGYMYITSGVENAQKPIFFADGAVNLKVGETVTNTLTNENGTTPTYSTSNGKCRRRQRQSRLCKRN